MNHLAVHRRALDLLLSAAAEPLDRGSPTGRHHGLLLNSPDLADWALRPNGGCPRSDPLPDEELLGTAESVAARVRPGPDFAEPTTGEQDGRFSRLLAALGRDPRWGR